VSISQKVYSVGTTPVTVVAPTADYAKYAVKNIQPATVDGYARDGYIYVLSRQFSVAAGASAYFSMTAGATGAQFDFYSIVSDSSSIYATLTEGSTITTTGSAIPARNLNRNYSDAHNAVLSAASSITGGTVVSADFVTASNQGGGEMSSTKIHTLVPNTQYGMTFLNQGNQTTNVFFQLGFSEHYNGYNRIWLETINDSYVLNAGEELTMELPPLATINAVSSINSNKLAVMRID